MTISNGDNPLPEFVDSDAYGMISGIAEQQQHVYNCTRVGGDEGNLLGKYYLSADVENAGDHCYVGNVNPDTKSEGFGGRLMTFPLVEGHELGKEVVIRGPWHSNSHSHMLGCGVNLMEKHHTRVLIAHERASIKGPTGQYIDRQRYTGILHHEPEPVLGEYRRFKDLARQYADDLGEPVFYYMRSNGGSTAGRQDPTEQENKVI